MAAQSPGHPSVEITSGPAPHELEETASNVVSSELWHEYLSLYLTIARQRGEDLSIIDLDINSLKAANDELGHQAGDQLIQIVDRVADAIPKELRTHENGAGRPADLVASTSYKPLETSLPDDTKLPGPESFRVGGDEFAILLPATDREGAQVVADRLLETVDHTLAEPQNALLRKLGAGVAIGVYTFKAGDNASQGMREADMAMYEHKLEQARPLSPDEEVAFWTAVEHLEAAGVRPRDVPKYIEKLGASTIAHAFRNQVNQDQLTFEIPDEADQPQ